MKAISLHQPYATLWLMGIKRHETRSWATSYRGPILVHAAKVSRYEDIPGPLWEKYGNIECPTGCLLGVMSLQDCQLVEYSNPANMEDILLGDWSDGRFAWLALPIAQFKDPIPYRGNRRIFNVPDEIIG